MAGGAHAARTLPPSQHPTPPGEVSFVIAAGLSLPLLCPLEEQTASHVFPRRVAVASGLNGCGVGAGCGRGLWWAGTQGEGAMVPDLELRTFSPWARTYSGSQTYWLQRQVRVPMVPPGTSGLREMEQVPSPPGRCRVPEGGAGARQVSRAGFLPQRMSGHRPLRHSCHVTAPTSGPIRAPHVEHVADVRAAHSRPT